MFGVGRGMGRADLCTGNLATLFIAVDTSSLREKTQIPTGVGNKSMFVRLGLSYKLPYEAGVGKAMSTLLSFLFSVTCR